MKYLPAAVAQPCSVAGLAAAGVEAPGSGEQPRAICGGAGGRGTRAGGCRLGTPWHLQPAESGSRSLHSAVGAQLPALCTVINFSINLHSI